MVNRYLFPSFQIRKNNAYHQGKTEFKVSVSQTSKINIQWAQAMEELKKDFENQVREVQEKLGKEMREMQEKHEKQVNTLLKEIQKNAEENNTF